MKITNLMIAAATLSFALAGPVYAEDIKQLCVDTVTADATAAGEESDAAAVDEACRCLADASAGNDAMETNLVEIAALPVADREAASSEETNTAIEACFPQAEAE